MLDSSSSLRRAFIGLVGLSLVVVAVQAGCGDSGGSDFGNGSSSGTSGDFTGPGFGPGDGEGGASSSGTDPNVTGTLDVTPPQATINVTITNGVVSAPPQTFVASYGGAPIAATWLFDRGELGDINASGVFTASGKNVGEGTVTARYGAREGTAKVKIVINASQNGAPAGVDAGVGGLGGAGGVGGEPLGPSVDAATIEKLKTQSTPPANPAQLDFLYPYDKTVWPRGLLPPLLMWQTTKEAAAVYVKVSQSNYTFEGTYSVNHFTPSSVQRKRSRIQEDVWQTATSGNQGDDLKLEVKIYVPSENKVYGPITRTWKVAPGILKGTVYYNSYDSELTTGGGAETGGVIAIQPRSANPVLALPNEAGKCHVCHEVSADGSSIWAQTDAYSTGFSYDLTKKPMVKTNYTGTANNRKFVWSAPYPDGTFALSSSYWVREAYRQGPSKLFNKATGAELPNVGFSGVVETSITPAFSPDGRKVVFNFWEGLGANGVTAGAGRSLAIMDFSCGAAAGSTKCADTPVYQFSNLRQIYKDNTRWPGWPSFLPDSSAAVFHNTVHGGECGPGSDGNGNYTPVKDHNENCQLTTWNKAKAELWIARDGTTQAARRLDAANGNNPKVPTSSSHPDDALVNYNPTVNPVASGGYYWVVFTSRRMYGNLITTGPWDGNGIKKLWVAAIDINNPDAAVDPSHPAFYLPGQEIEAGNTRGFWVVDPCKANGNSCETGDECCNGFCRKDTAGALVCQDQPPGGQCSQEFEKCTIDADCCNAQFKCIAGKCTRPAPVVK